MSDSGEGHANADDAAGESLCRSRVLVGTASWTDPTLIRSKKFYPAQVRSAEGRLRYYASRFPLVEVDSSYYALPSATNAALWAERTPANFTFNVKAFRLFTGHQTPLAALPPAIRTALGPLPAGKANVYYRNMPGELRDAMWRFFLEALEPLRAAGKLGAVHFQFAPWFVRSAEARAHIVECRERMRGHRLAVEFRHRSWFSGEAREQTLAFEREHMLVNVVVDEPQGTANSIPAVWEVTNADLAVVRLHGRNAGTWNSPEVRSSSDRFNYDYPDAELADLARSIEALAEQVARTHVIFNNNYEDQGQRNATTLMRLLRRERRQEDRARDGNME